jgi:hypothetical protein
VRLQQIESSPYIDNKDQTFVPLNTHGAEHSAGGIIDGKVFQTLKLQLDEMRRKTERKVEKMGKKME